MNHWTPVIAGPVGAAVGAAVKPEKAARCWRALLALPPVHHALHAAVEARLAPPPQARTR